MPVLQVEGVEGATYTRCESGIFCFTFILTFTFIDFNSLVFFLFNGLDWNDGMVSVEELRRMVEIHKSRNCLRNSRSGLLIDAQAKSREQDREGGDGGRARDGEMEQDDEEAAVDSIVHNAHYNQAFFQDTSRIFLTNPRQRPQLPQISESRPQMPWGNGSLVVVREDPSGATTTSHPASAITAPGDTQSARASLDDRVEPQTGLSYTHIAMIAIMVSCPL